MFNLKTGGFALIRMEDTLPYRTCQGVNSIHVVLGELDFCFPLNTCVQKAVWFHVRVKLCLLNTSNWDFTFQKWSTKMINRSTKAPAMILWPGFQNSWGPTFWEQWLSQSSVKILDGRRKVWSSFFQDHMWRNACVVTISLKSPVSF